MSKSKKKKPDLLKKAKFVPIKSIPYHEIKKILDKQDPNRHRKN